MNADIKRHIDSAKQVLVGVVPNPAGQVDQITNALIYKFMDDMDQAAVKAGGEPSFFVGDLQKYSWSRLIDSRLGNQEKMNMYSEALLKLSESVFLPELFRQIFKSAFLPYRSPEVLGLFLKEINYFDYSHPEDLGDAYEYLLSIMSSQGDAGQFRTPRHIIDFIVDVVNPTKDDKVLDPACGTAGFLISSFKHILEQHDRKNDPANKEKALTPDQRRNLMNNFEGYDIDPGMVRIAQVNMYLHQFKNPKIYQYDTLSMDERWNDKFDVILANPPFMSPKGGIRPHSKFSVQSSRSEVLFVDYIMNHLRPRGRAGIIVPEGIIFQSGTAHKQLRKNLVNDGLYAVVSLPPGVFNPYSGVKTSILLFDGEFAKSTNEILFIKIESDGFDLGAQRKASIKNDLPEALVIIRKWLQGKRNKTKIAHWVKKEKIGENDEYNLSGDRYLVATNYDNVKWPLVELGEVCEFIGKGKRPASFATEHGKIPFIVSSLELKKCNSADYEMEAIIIGDGGSANIHYLDGRFSASDHTYILRKKSGVELYLKYVYLIIRNNLNLIEKGFQGQGLKNVSKKHLVSIKIPLPPMKLQEQIIAELDGYQKIIDGVKTVVENWKPQFIVKSEYLTKKLSEVCVLITDGTHKTPKYVTEGVPFLRVTDLTASNDSKKYISKDEHLELIKRCNPKKGDVLYSKNGTIGVAKLVDWEWEFSIFVSLCLLRPNKEILDPKYLEIILNTDYALNQAKSHSKSGTVTNLHLIEIKQIKIPLPTMEEQYRIITEYEKEKKLIDSSRDLEMIFKCKLQDRIKEVWGE